MKKYFKFDKKTLIAVALGTVIFAILFRFVNVPTGFPKINIQIAYGAGAFIAAVFGPLAGGLTAFLGHAISDTLQYGAPFWSWVTASGIAMFITGFAFARLKVNEGECSVKDIILFNVYQVIGHLFAWCLIAPVLDILIYAEDSAYVFTQGIWAAIPNLISSGVIGSVLLFLYAKTRAKKAA